MLLYSILTSEWMSWLSQEAVWDESNASWQWIVSIDSTTSNSLPLQSPLHVSSFRVFSPALFLPVCERVCTSVDSDRTKKNHPTGEFIQLSCLLRQPWMNCQHGEKSQTCWFDGLTATDWLFQSTATVPGLGRSCLRWLMKPSALTNRRRTDDLASESWY